MVGSPYLLAITGGGGNPAEMDDGEDTEDVIGVGNRDLAPF